MDAFIIIVISLFMFSAGWVFKTINFYCNKDGYLKIVTDLTDKSKYTYLDLNIPPDLLEKKDVAIFAIKTEEFK